MGKKKKGPPPIQRKGRSCATSSISLITRLTLVLLFLLHLSSAVRGLSDNSNHDNNISDQHIISNNKNILLDSSISTTSTSATTNKICDKDNKNCSKHLPTSTSSSPTNSETIPLDDYENPEQDYAVIISRSKRSRNLGRKNLVI